MEIEAIQRLNIRPGDRLVVKVKSHLSMKQMETIRDQIKAFAPEAELLVIPETVEFTVLPEAE